MAAWIVNDSDYTLGSLGSGNLAGHNRTPPPSTNILISIPMNSTQYICISQTNNGTYQSEPAYLYIAGNSDLFAHS